MESRDSAIIIALIIISSIINIGYIFDHERQETAHQSDYNLLLEEIHILQNSVTDLKEQILNIHEILIENRQPEELDIFSLQDLTQGVEYVKLDLNSLNLVDPGNALSTTSDSLKWTTLKRDNDTHTFLKYNQTLEYFVHKFEFSINEFTYGEGPGRRLASFWKVSDNEVRVEPTNFTHFYAQTSGDQTEKYVLVFNQRFKGDNQFVYISSMLNVSETYYATIVKIGDVIELAVHTDSERTELIWAPGPQILSENMYKYLLLCVTRDFGVDREVWSSGHISYLETYNFN